jgi:alpha-L-fucosidase 2
MLKFAILSLVLVSSVAFGDDLKLWYPKPAEKWEEALPVGSGRLGAMVFGGVATERIQFNEDTLWTGRPRSYVRAGAREHLPQVRELVFAGKQEEASNLFRKSMISDPVRQKAYQPFGDLRLRFPGHDQPADYRRELDLTTATAKTSYKVGDVTYTREVFASYPDNAIVVHITASQPKKLTMDVQLDSPHRKSTTRPSQPDTLVLTGEVVDPKAPEDPGMRFEGRARVIAPGTTVEFQGSDVATVKDADSVTITVIAATSFENFENMDGNPTAKCDRYAAAIKDRTVESLRQAHVADFQKLFNRVTINLGTSDKAQLPTDERVKLARKSSNPSESTKKNPDMPAQMLNGLNDDPQLAALFFQYGRYMLITASRPGTQAANLQGVWNELLDPPWESKYTVNINAEMNYWPAELTNLSETHEPFFDMIDDLRKSGAITAREQYGCRGWVLHHNTDLWRGTAPINNIDGMWPTGAAWLCHHLWERYQFTGDKDFLARRAYPAMKEAALFFVDFLVKDPKTGFLVTNPSHSPEQGELNAGPAMDMQLIRALIDYTTEASQILGNVDAEFIAELAAIRKQLVPDQVGHFGQLAEWQIYPGEPPKWKADLDKANNNHRHMSPLWGLYPGSQFTPQSDPRIYDAAKVLLKNRGDGSTGWSFAWRIPLWARVGDGDFAYRQLQLLMGRRVLPNLFDLCGPYQADGNYGATGGIAEMLLQSHLRNAPPPAQDYLIDVLPALPAVWPKGNIAGLKARGGFTVDIQWDGGRVQRVVLHSVVGNPCTIRYGEQKVALQTEPGKSYTLNAQLRAAN